MATILVVEEEQEVARALAEALCALGHRVPQLARSADEALRHLDAVRPDLVLLDERLEGAGAATGAALQGRAGVPVVYLGAGSAESAAVSRSTTPHGYLQLPIRPGALAATVELALQRHALEARLREREAWLTTTLHAIGEGVVVVDAAGRVALVNAVAEQLTGFTEAEALGQPLSAVLRVLPERPGASAPCPLQGVLEVGGEPARAPGEATTLLLGSRSRGELPVDLSTGPIRDDEGRLLGAVLVFRDVSARRRMQEQLALNERLAALGTLAAGVAHEINNPLAFTLSNVHYAAEELEAVDALLAGPALDARQLSELRARMGELREALREAADGGARVKHIVADLRDFARGGRDRAGAVDVVAVVERALRMAGKTLAARARVERSLLPVPAVEGSAGGLSQVLLNLVLNAAQAIPEGAPERHCVRVGTRVDAQGRVVVSVRDSGSGMSPEVQRRIFDPFFTTKPPGVGTGLGLSVSHGIVTALGGSISVWSEPGVGTEFRVALPAVQPVPRAAQSLPR
ncbi:PAS domain S-box protein [Aggregicoccus sp. 17bor-14]|uniref:ATP-binding response regulator n=1 Tax=Myxococcaceae TaxID=31 RepID=UPI00129CEDD8|nr:MULTISPECIES: ATP-binding protein [Myxococcaceae]MBF5043444.1 PAS domain S-box protein [Simulacricoccus sp. 17bor-14]MRI89202.1 PAS domain S-box protein [Aggregicoccus sp. 17bor-14]